MTQIERLKLFTDFYRQLLMAGIQNPDAKQMAQILLNDETGLLRSGDDNELAERVSLQLNQGGQQ